MPAQQRYDAPHEQLRDLGVEAKREGLSFEEFWARSVRTGESPAVTTESARTIEPPAGAVVWPRDSIDHANARAAINGTKEGWRRAYEGEPATQGDRALLILCQIAVEASGGIPTGDAVPLAA